LGYLQKANGSWSDSSREALDLLLDSHFPGTQQTGHTPERSAGEGIKLDLFLSDRNMKRSITHPKSRTNSHKLVEKIFHSILLVGELTSFLLKSFERMISLHIRATFDLTQISEVQHAYTKGKSTESALHLVVSSIEKSLSIKEYILIAFLDIEGAFNKVLPIAITESPTELGVEPPIVGLIHKLLISRVVTATLGTSTHTRLVNRGTPQGGLLSPLLWNIAVRSTMGVCALL